MSADDIRRAISRIAHEIVERNQGIDGVVLVGLQRGGTWIADALGSRIADIEPQSEVIVGRLDVSMYRDDIGMRPVVAGAVSDIPRDITDAVVVLVDDVLYTGRTIRAVINELFDYGRPSAVQLAVLVDRGGRELPMQADFAAVRLTLPASQSFELARDAQGRFSFVVQDKNA